QRLLPARRAADALRRGPALPHADLLPGLADGGPAPCARYRRDGARARARAALRALHRRRLRSHRLGAHRRQHRLPDRRQAQGGRMTQPIALLDGPFWPYLALILFAVLPTE